MYRNILIIYRIPIILNANNILRNTPCVKYTTYIRIGTPVYSQHSLIKIINDIYFEN